MEDAPRNYGVEDTEGQQSVNIADTSFGRHVLPRPTNGEASPDLNTKEVEHFN